jgi:hypothetical protein
MLLYRLTLLLCLLTVASLPCGESQAQTAKRKITRGAETFSTITLKELQTALMDNGYRAEIGSDNAGEYIKSGSGGVTFFVSLADCPEDGSGNCETIRMETGTFKLDKPVSFETLNNWNRENGRGWAVPTVNSDGEHYLFTQISITGGVTKDWLKTYLAIFTSSMTTYHRMLFP